MAPAPAAPSTADGKARSARNSTRHGLRARSVTPVTAFGETQAVLDAHLAAYRRELASPRRLRARPRRGRRLRQPSRRPRRAPRGPAPGPGRRGVELTSQHPAPAPPGRWSCATAARPSSPPSAPGRNSRRWPRARAAGLLPDEAEAAAAEAELDAALAGLCPNEPEVDETRARRKGLPPPPSRPTTTPRRANPNPSRHPNPRLSPTRRPTLTCPTPTVTCRLLLGPMRAYACCDRAALTRFCRGPSPGERLQVRAMLAAPGGQRQRTGPDRRPGCARPPTPSTRLGRCSGPSRRDRKPAGPAHGDATALRRGACAGRAFRLREGRLRTHPEAQGRS